MSVLKKLAAAFTVSLLAGPLGACNYDYMQHTDRVGFRTGDAVKANLERETADPSHPLIYNTAGLGRDGVRKEVSDTKKTASDSASNCAPGSASTASTSCASSP